MKRKLPVDTQLLSWAKEDLVIKKETCGTDGQI